MAKSSDRMEKLKKKICKLLEKKRLERAANFKNLASELKKFKVKFIVQKSIKNINQPQFKMKHKQKNNCNKIDSLKF